MVGSAYMKDSRKTRFGQSSQVRPGSSKLSQIYRLVISSDSALPELAEGKDNIDWDCVRFVDILSDSLPVCSICLDHVSIPQLLQCGHCFCLSCILLHLTSACNCCVCNEYARPSDLRSVRFQFISLVELNSSRTFQLVRIDRGVTLPLGSDEQYIPNQQSVGWWFSRVTTATDTEVRQFHLSELSHLYEGVSPSANEEEGIHAIGMSQAVEFLSSRLSSLDEPAVASPSNRQRYSSTGFVSIDIESLARLPRSQYRPGEIYTYRLVDGQHVYLDPLWVRVLLLHFSDEADTFEKVDRLPTSLSLPIIFRTSLSLGHESRRRYKFLSHLPIGTPVTLCDVDLRGVVSLECLQHFAAPISRKIQVIKRAKAQQRIDRRDVERAKAVPLSKEWESDILNHFPASFQRDKIPTEEDFVALTTHSAPEPDDLRQSYAHVAADLASLPGDFQESITRRPSAGEILKAFEKAPRTKKGGVKFRLAG